MKTRQGRYAYKLIDKDIAVAGGMSQVFYLKQRTLPVTQFDETSPTQAAFVTVLTIMGKVEVKKNTPRFDGVTIRNEQTHIGYTTWDTTVFKLDINSLFIEVEYSYGNKQYKVLAIQDYSEQNKFIEYSLKETGFIDKIASQI